MDASKLSDYQLYQLSKNYKLDKAILDAVNKEISHRNLSEENLQLISFVTEKERNSKPYKTPNIFLLLAFPVVWIVHVIVSKKFSGKHEEKWNKYWLFFFIGLLIWAIAIIFLTGISIASAS